MNFELLHNEDIKLAYNIICERIENLKEKGINQYERPYPPMELYLERQRNNTNFGLYYENNLIGLVTLIKNYTPKGWEADIKSDNFLWLTTLFIPLKYKGKKYGEKILEMTDDYAQQNRINEIFLDCYFGDGFLENYYEKFGYKRIIKKIVRYPSRSFEALLMRKEFNT